MALPIDLDQVEEIAGYNFRNRELLGLALQSAQRDRDESTGQVNVSDGNRRLAKLGYSIIGLNITRAWFQSGLNHRHFDLIQKRLSNKNYLSDTAQELGLASCLVISQRQEGIAPPPTTLKSGLTAIIAAIWEDSGQDLDVASQVMEKWRFYEWDFLVLEG